MSVTSPVYPLRVEGELEPRLSRWLWLVKWLLAIPHIIVLAFLWVAFAVLTVVAFFAVLFTGRYPRGIFEFNVGVLRWTWRVGFYSYSALGTDRYPPFTLDDVPDYPAHLSIEHPQERLRRGLPLIGWWLLGIPQYVIAGIFAGGTWVAWRWGEHVSYPAGGGGLIGILVLVAAVVLLFKGRYPTSIFDLVVGLNRWVLRVTAYAAFMTREYPPFRLDSGGSDPSAAAINLGAIDRPADELEPPSVAQAVAPPTAAPARWTFGRVVLLVLGSLAALVSVGLFAVGGVVVWADQTQRDADGFLMSPSDRFATATSAITTGFRKTSNALAADALGTTQHGPSWLFDSDLFGTIRIHATSLNGKPVFVGIAHTGAVDEFLAGVPRAELTGYSGGSPDYRTIGGTNTAAAPTRALAWAASTTGPGPQVLTWKVQSGDWTIVTMNADGSRGVSADVSLGARVAFLLWVGVGLLIAGGLVLAAGVAMIYAGGRTRTTAAASSR